MSILQKSCKSKTNIWNYKHSISNKMNQQNIISMLQKLIHRYFKRHAGYVTPYVVVITLHNLGQYIV